MNKKINQIKRLIAERTENLKYLQNDHPERNYNLEIIQILKTTFQIDACR